MSKIFSKSLITLTLSLVLGLGLALNAAAQTQADPFAGQPAMTDAEAKKYVGILNDMVAAGQDQAKVMQIMQNSGMDQMRFAYVTAKFNAAIGIIKQGDAIKEQLPPAALPTDAELAIVKKYEGGDRKSVV